MRRDVVATAKIGVQEVRLLEADEGFRIIIASPHDDNLYEKALLVRWTCRTREVAQKAFEWAVAMERLWEAMKTGCSRETLFEETERLALDLNATARRLNDFPPGTAGAADMDSGNHDE